jgi:hypothetical protein
MRKGAVKSMLVLVKIQYQIGLVEETLIIQSQYYEYMMGLLKKHFASIKKVDFIHMDTNEED